jgi:RNA polymerase sigma-70 factor (ECF subfamily)
MADDLDLAALVDEARAAWPQLSLADELFVAYLRERLEPGVAVADQPLRPYVGDLYLACACATGASPAIGAFRARYGRDLAALFDRPQRRGVDAADLVQSLLEHLFVGDGERPPRITEYRGRGSLRTWLRVVALRRRLNAERGRAVEHEVALEDFHGGPSAPNAFGGPVEVGPSEVWNAELEYLKAHYRQAFRVAFADAVAGLDPRDRGILRLHVVHGLSATGIAGAFGVHRATAKRWLATVRGQLLEATRKRLAGALAVDAGELDSIMQLIGSRLDASVRRCLEPDEAARAKAEADES